MSLVVSILFVVGIFALVGLVAWAAIAHLQAHASTGVSRLSVFDASLKGAPETAGHFAR